MNVTKYPAEWVKAVAPSTPASTSAVAPLPATSAVQDESIPGIGATRANWDAWHTPNGADNNGSVYGEDAWYQQYAAPLYTGVLLLVGAVYYALAGFATKRAGGGITK